MENNGARFIQWNCALDALMTGTYSFKDEIDSQINTYGKEETFRVVNFLLNAMNDKLPSGIAFTEKQKEYLLVARCPDEKNAEKIQRARMALADAYRKCDWQYI